MDRISLIIAEDHNIVRAGLINILENVPDIYLAAEAEDGIDLIEKYDKLKPDIILSDISMPRLSGISAAQKIISMNKKAKIIFLTAFTNNDLIYKTITIGVRGLVSKNALSSELVTAIREVANNRYFFSGKSDVEIKSIKNKFRETKSSNKIPAVQILNDREKEVVYWISLGLTSEEIADKMMLSKKVVDHYRASVMAKKNLKNVPQLIKFAIEFSINEKMRL